jgi:hypothetical protein
MNPSASGLVPVHIGQPQPGSEQERSLFAQNELGRTGYGEPRRLRVPGGLDFQKHGLAPRWLGMETSDCSAALEPGFFHNRGAAERARFIAGARARGEVALVVAIVGDADDDRPRSVMSRSDASIHVSSNFTSIEGLRLPVGTRPAMARDLSPVDRDLALRLLNRPAGSPWWALHLSGAHAERGDGSGVVTYEAEGRLDPILVDGLGDPVVAAWTSPTDDQRWYVIPDATEWDTILEWLVHRAFAELVPGALRRARSTHFADPELLTADELAMRRSLDEVENRYSMEKQRLEQDLQEAERRAAPVRSGLLYGTGDELVQAVAAVFRAAGLSVDHLDEALGDTKSADLLVSLGDVPPRLVEVKSASGTPREDLVATLQRHLATWPQLRPNEPVAGGVLVVNHQHKLHPSERAPDVYSRPEFVAALPFSVLSAKQLFQWWRSKDWSAIRGAVLGTDAPTGPLSSAPSNAEHEGPRAGRWWLGRRRRP